MGIRKRSVATAILIALATPAAPSAQDAPPRFRSRVELMTVDVAAIDAQGRPVEDLQARDFAVKVDGKSRPVVSAQLIKVDRSQVSVVAVANSDPLVTTNSDAGGSQGGRRVVIAVDQTLITPGSIQPVMRTASRFVDGLAPADYAAVLAFPEPGPRVDFTLDKASVRDALPKIVGQPQKIRTTTFNLSIQEAQTIDASERTMIDTTRIMETLGPTMRRVLERGCRSIPLQDLTGDQLQECVRLLQKEAAEEAQESRIDATMSLRRLQSYLKELATLDGSKSMVLVSAGIVSDDEALIDDLGKLAADARTTINVVAVDRERERDRTDLPNGQSTGSLQDRGLELHALETIADRTGGTLYRAIGPAEGVFDRLSLEMSASYVIGVERHEGDPGRQRIEVSVKRRGVTVRSPRNVTSTAAANAARPIEDVLRDVLGSPLPIGGVPVRLSTFVRRDASGQSYRLNLAAQVGQPGTQSGDVAVGYAVVDQQNRVVTSSRSRAQLGASGAGDSLQYDSPVTLQPGTYSVRFGVVDREGRRGLAIRHLELPAVSGLALTTSDLIVGTAANGELLHPSVEPRVDGALTAYIELYPPESDQARLTVTLEIAEGEASPPLTAAALNIGAGIQANWRVASGAVDAALLPGRYVARASIRRDGVPVRVVSRPFLLERRTATAATATGSALPTSLRPGTALKGRPYDVEARARTAGYVSAFVRGLSNVVGEEDFTLSDPDRRVTSDFLLVQYPGSAGDLLTYRDVTAVNGVAVPNREERLADLFLKPIGLVRDRVRQITTASEEHVPSILNPIYVLAFLQADFQPRFELTVTDAGSEWPSAVKAVTFVEVARPTIMRGGLRGDLDVPMHGTAWLEPATGRVLQTELVIGSGRSAPTITTKFALDRRLQIMVPEQMRTQNPNGLATYRNFRRFNVATDTSVADPPH